MKNLISQIHALRQTPVKDIVEQKIAEFEEVLKSEDKVFSELCFCITTANSSAEMGLKVQKNLEKEIAFLTKDQLSQRLKSLGYRFYNKRAHYIFHARQFLAIKKMLADFNNERDARDWLAENVLGIGYKEASHFLRNIGYKNCAILDRHIIRTMHENKMIDEQPKTITKKKYLEMEKKLDKLAEHTGLDHARLDLYMWYMKTGKILK
ncbi:MAG: N-glycosylase/DNA lyase [Candidatus Micrarchaeota archaeon]